MNGKTFSSFDNILRNRHLRTISHKQYSLEVLGHKCTRKARQNKAHTRVQLFQTLERRARKKLISTYEAVFCFTPF